MPVVLRSFRAALPDSQKRDLTMDALVASVAVAVEPAAVLTAASADFEMLLDGYDAKVLAV